MENLKELKKKVEVFVAENDIVIGTDSDNKPVKISETGLDKLIIALIIKYVTNHGS